MNYGRGALHVHAGAEEEEGRRLLGPDFYAGLVLHPLRDCARPLGHRLALTALMGRAQAATTAGYIAETRDRSG